MTTWAARSLSTAADAIGGISGAAFDNPRRGAWKQSRVSECVANGVDNPPHLGKRERWRNRAPRIAHAFRRRRYVPCVLEREELCVETLGAREGGWCGKKPANVARPEPRIRVCVCRWILSRASFQFSREKSRGKQTSVGVSRIRTTLRPRPRTGAPLRTARTPLPIRPLPRPTKRSCPPSPFRLPPPPRPRVS